MDVSKRNGCSLFVWAFVSCLLAAFVLVPVSLALRLNNVPLEQKLQERLFSVTVEERFLLLVVIAPLVEEILFRGPVQATMMLLAALAWVVRKLFKKRLFERRVVCNMTVADVIVWFVAIIASTVWASLHAFPLLMFAMGLIFSWLVMKTHIGQSMALHATWNLIIFLLIEIDR